MPPNPALELANVTLVGQNKTAVVVGGTLGMGAAIARLLAKLGCSRVYIVGRNETRGQAMVETLKNLVPVNATIQAEFIQGDVGEVQGMRATAEVIQTTVGDASIDFLVMCQSGVPTGHLDKVTADGLCPDLSVQSVSRFAIAYLLTTRGALAPNATVVSVANQGQSLDDLDVDDLSLAQRVGKMSTTQLFMAQSARDSTVLDAFHEQLTQRYPQYRYFHISPGLVSSEQFDYNLFPGWLSWVAWLGMKLTGKTPDEFAPAVVYILAAPTASETLGPTNRYFKSNLAPSVLGKWAADKGNRERCWDKLCEIVGER
ncbi:hypothetical protein FB45DRAFT_898616 [Roridomyces roridus]|uniref:NAD(P)-binding protein n=1 Tax=Roridomyces roridus TaxID=1738132 RepID=A0AAD7CCF5_9AGAR|nr:hypothetical protein FB45DRAFT_898616 [Roridomyces roridus]